MKKYYDENKQKFTIKEEGEDKVSPFENVKSSISSTLQQEKFIELEQAYIDRLKQKYPVVIHDDYNYPNQIHRAFLCYIYHLS